MSDQPTQPNFYLEEEAFSTLVGDGNWISGTFAWDVLELCFSKKLIVYGLWPDHRTRPADIGTDVKPSPNEIDLPTYSTMILKGHPLTKKSTQ